MKKVDSTVLRETGFIALSTLILSVLMEAIFLIIGRWDYTVLLGNLLGYAAAVANFFLMGVTVQKAVQYDEDKQAASLMKLSQSLRMLMLFVTAALGVLLPCFNVVTSLVPLFFPRLAINFRPLLDKKSDTADKP